jgi:hypothetical protein
VITAALQASLYWRTAQPATRTLLVTPCPVLYAHRPTHTNNKGYSIMNNRVDKVIVTTLKTMAVFVALASVFAADTASADYRPYKYLEHNGFDTELQHCIELLRPTLNAPAESKVEYLVEDVRLRGPWYRFELTASVVESNGTVSLDGFKVLCKSNRWVDSARLIERRNDTATNRRLVVKNSSELITYRATASNTETPQ